MEKNRIIDGLASFMSDATDKAKGFGKEAQNVFGSQIEKAVSKLDLVKSDDFEVLKMMVTNISQENAALKKRIQHLESLQGIKNDESSDLNSGYASLETPGFGHKFETKHEHGFAKVDEKIKQEACSVKQELENDIEKIVDSKPVEIVNDAKKTVEKALNEDSPYKM